MSQPDPVDIHVGRIIRAKRMAKGLTLDQLAHGIGVSHQQVCKYETGTNRLVPRRSIVWACPRHHAGCLLSRPEHAYASSRPTRRKATRRKTIVGAQGRPDLRPQAVSSACRNLVHRGGQGQPDIEC